jgi:hypothetical protein
VEVEAEVVAMMEEMMVEVVVIPVSLDQIIVTLMVLVLKYQKITKIVGLNLLV